MILENEIKLNFDDVLIVPKRSTIQSRAETSLFREFKFRWARRSWNGIPIMASNMDTIGTFDMAHALSVSFLPTVIHKHYTLEDWKSYKHADRFDFDYTIPSIGVKEEDLELFTQLKLHSFYKENIGILCIDVANGYGEYLPKFISQVRERFPDIILIAGNVVTREMTEQLILSGADIVKVGIGSGSACSTTTVTGVGYPQLSAIIECADGAHGLGGHIISDGGCKKTADIAKAFGAGADFVMLGGMFAGHDECGGEIIDPKSHNKYMQFYGMSSQRANEKYNGGMKSYRASEGKELRIPYKGSVKDTVKDILGGLRSTCTYVGAKTLKELPKRATFIRVNSQNYQ